MNCPICNKSFNKRGATDSISYSFKIENESRVHINVNYNGDNICLKCSSIISNKLIEAVDIIKIQSKNGDY